MGKLKISFDFDSTLTEKPMQELAKKFLAHGIEVFITTSRGTEMYGGTKLDNSDVFQLADELGIPRENITFTNYEDKYTFVKDMDAHFDDDSHEIFLINEYPSKCIGFLFEEKNKQNQQVNF